MSVEYNDTSLEKALFNAHLKTLMIRALESDRTRFVFVYVFELGYSQRETANAIGVHETEISRQMRYIRERLQPFKQGYTL